MSFPLNFKHKDRKRPRLHQVPWASWSPVASGGRESIPPLPSSVPPLLDDSVGEDEGIMGILDRWSSIIFLWKCLLEWSMNAETLLWRVGPLSLNLKYSSKNVQNQFLGFRVPGGHTAASTVLQPLVWRCRWAGVLPWAQSHTCCMSCVSSLWPSWSVTVCGFSTAAGPQKGTQGVERGGED